MPIKLLLNNKEIANFLNSKIDLVEHLKKFEQNMAHTAETIMWIRDGITKKGLENLDKDNKKNTEINFLGASKRIYPYGWI